MAIARRGTAARHFQTLFDVGAIRELTDGQLLERFATSGGEAGELAFAALVDRHGPMVFRVCLGVLGDAHESEDAFQAAFLVLARKGRGLWVRESLGPWLHQVAYRTASSARLAAARRRRHEQGAAILRYEAQVEARDDLDGVLHEEIERLPERFRAPLVLCDLEGRSHEQAARHLGWPVGTVKSRQARGRDRLRNRLRRRGVAPEPAILTTALRAGEASTLVSPAFLDCTTKAVILSVASRTVAAGSAATLAQGVLRSMYLAQWLKAVSVLFCLAATTSGAILLAQNGAVVAPSRRQVPLAPRGDVPVVTVKPAPLRFTVIERGSLEAAESHDAYCLVEGQTTIIQIRPEGTPVKKGEVVCVLDSAYLKDQLVNQKITEKSAEVNYQNAKLTREVAEIAITEYRDGIYKADLGALKNAAAAAELAIQKADARLERTRAARKRVQDALAKKGAEQTPTDIVAELDVEDRLESAELTLVRERMALDQANARLDVLQKLTLGRTMMELKADVDRKQSAELARKAAWELEHSKARKLERQILACDIKAPVGGMLVHANDPSRSPERRRAQIEEGATVRERQKIFSVIEPGGPMQVNTKVHESQVNRLARNMKASIRVDAFPDQTLSGWIRGIAPLPDPQNLLGSGANLYTTKVSIDQRLPALRPGMTARVDVLVSQLDNVISVPVAAVVRYDNKDHVAVRKADGTIEWREVTLGLSNDEIVEVKQGLKSGEQAAYEPRELLTEQQKRAMSGSATAPAANPSPPE